MHVLAVRVRSANGTWDMILVSGSCISCAGCQTGLSPVSVGIIGWPVDAVLAKELLSCRLDVARGLIASLPLEGAVEGAAWSVELAVDSTADAGIVRLSVVQDEVRAFWISKAGGVALICCIRSVLQHLDPISGRCSFSRHALASCGSWCSCPAQDLPVVPPWSIVAVGVQGAAVLVLGSADGSDVSVGVVGGRVSTDLLQL